MPDSQGTVAGTPPAAPSASAASVPSSPTPQAAPSAGGDWRSALPDDIRGHASLADFKDVPSLAKSYVNQQPLIGADKIVIPGKDAPAAEWDALWNRLGRPEKPDGYALPDQLPGPVDQAAAKAFFGEAHRLGLNKQQAAALVRYHNEQTKAASDRAAADAAAAREAVLDGLRKEWGGAFDQNAALVHDTAKRFGGDEFLQFLNDTGLGDHPLMIRMFHKIGRAISQDEIIGTGGRTQFQLTPGQAEAQLNSKYADRNFMQALMDRSHPDHAKAKAEEDRLKPIAWPGKTDLKR